MTAELKRPKKTIVFEAEVEMKDWLEEESRRRGGQSVSSLVRLAVESFRKIVEEGRKESPVNGRQ